MKRLLSVLLPTVAVMGCRASDAGQQVDPIGKVISMLKALEAELEHDQVREEKAYHAYVEWCDENSHQRQHEVEALLVQKEKLESTNTKAKTDQEEAKGHVDKVAIWIKKNGEELEAANAAREQEEAEFEDSEAELMAAGKLLDQAIHVLEKEMEKNPASFAQTVASVKGDSLVSTLGAVLDAASFLAEDIPRLLDLVRQQQEYAEEDSGAPAAATYESHSGSIVDMLQDLKEKAETQLKDLRRAEAAHEQNFKLLTEGFKAQLAADEHSLQDEQAFVASATETDASSQKELVFLRTNLEDTQNSLSSIQQDCMRTASDHDASVEARAKERKVLAQALAILEESTQDASEATYSLLQLRAATGMETRQHRVARMVRQLAKEHHSKALAQLASRIGAVAKFGARNGEDPFAKIKGLISDLISRLQQEAKQEAEEKAYCDQQLAETQKKKEHLEFREQKLRVRHDSKVSTAKRLTAKIAELQEVITQLTQEQVDVTNLRDEERKTNTQLQADLQEGLLGLQKAYRLLRRYYGAKDEGEEAAALLQESQGQPSKPVSHKKREGAGSDILALLEVCEADVAQSLATVETEEANAQQAYEKRTLEIKVSLAQETANEKNKRKSVEALAMDVNQLRDDLGSRAEEISAVTEFLTELKSKCEGRATPAEERLRRRAAEIDGLQQALEQFDDASAATSFVQIELHDRRSLRQAAVDAP